MIISVRVKPRSKKSGFEWEADGTLVLKIHEPPVDGRANKAVIERVAELYGIAKSAVQIVSGETARTKRVEIPDGSTPRRI
jgi:uncharacterized protein (TIGR00251 family)